MEKIKNFFKTVVYLVVIPVIIAVLLFKIFTIKVNERSFIYASDAYISREKYPVGSGDYGFISNVSIKEGDVVSQGDLLVTYLTSTNADPEENEANTEDAQGREVVITSPVSGIISRIYYNRGAYIGPKDIILEIQDFDTMVEATISLKPEEINKVRVGKDVDLTSPDGTRAIGRIEYIYPRYDRDNGSLDVSIEPKTNLTNQLDGIPVVAKVYIEDELANRVNSIVDRIPNKEIRAFFK